MVLKPIACPWSKVRELNERCQKLGLEAVYATVQRHDDEEEPPPQGDADADAMADSIAPGSAGGTGGMDAADGNVDGVSGVMAGTAGSGGGGSPSGASPAAKPQEPDHFEEVSNPLICCSH